MRDSVSYLLLLVLLSQSLKAIFKFFWLWKKNEFSLFFREKKTRW